MSRQHRRETKSMRLSDRCGAKTRRATECGSPAVKGKRRCRMHGGAEGSGAPKGNQNALKHGRYTKSAIADRRAIRKLIREAGKFLDEFKS